MDTPAVVGSNTPDDSGGTLGNERGKRSKGDLSGPNEDGSGSGAGGEVE